MFIVLLTATGSRATLFIIIIKTPNTNIVHTVPYPISLIFVKLKCIYVQFFFFDNLRGSNS